MSDVNPLDDKRNWTEEKTWIIPLKITAMVDDAKKYDDVMAAFVKNLLNEIRSVTARLDKKGVKVAFGEPITNPEDADAVFKAAKGEVVSKESLANMVADLVNKKDKENKQ
ncbi:MAG: hypothetical protein E2O29_01465 [Deltaproteobacteria bacterium]|nr:MAG: hypothetical protein E2O29_01465 [Deltaproteobacteria bacterium]